MKREKRVRPRLRPWVAALGALLALVAPRPAQEESGSIRGVIFDRDFDVPLAGATAEILETGVKTTSGPRGNYTFGEVRPGTYTLVFKKPGYVNLVHPPIVVVAGALTDVNARLANEFVEGDEFVVQDVLQLGGGTEAALLQLRLDSPALIDSIGSDLISRAGASDAASALSLVSGATVQDGKFAVIRGLPDRYVSSQLNGVSLPTADEDKRAVELDQFPSAVLESVQVKKTFTPDQQGNASGGAVDVRLKGLPEADFFLQLKSQLGWNSQAGGEGSFLTYDGGGLDFFGSDDGDRDVQDQGLPGGNNWTGAVGLRETEAPVDSKWSAAFGKRHILEDGTVIGGFLSVFYERDSGYYDNGRSDSLWQTAVGQPLTPEYSQGTPLPGETPAGNDGDFLTALFDITKASQQVQWGGLASVGVETERHQLNLAFLYSRTAEDTATLAEDTRGKEFFFPGYAGPDDPTAEGNNAAGVNAAPYIRTETLDYVERATGSLQLAGQHRLEYENVRLGPFRFEDPEISWVASTSFANADQPDRRLFGQIWRPRSFDPGAPPFIPSSTSPAEFSGFRPDANINLGFLQRIFKTIEEDSHQFSLDVKWPFEQWAGEEGYLKVGYFDDRVDRTFRLDTFTNAGDNSRFQGDFEDSWADVFPTQNHPLTRSSRDVDYDGDLEIAALYGMFDLPLTSKLNLIAGARLESTGISVNTFPFIKADGSTDATWFDTETSEAILFPTDPSLLPDPDDFERLLSLVNPTIDRQDVLPSLGVAYEVNDRVTVRASYSETVARPTFKEITPVLQEEFLGGPIFIGNPRLRPSQLKNYDLRVDYRPYEGGLLSASLFYKDIEDPIEYAQRSFDFSFTIPDNYPEGKISGVELEVRQDVGHFYEAATGLAAGANATFIDSEVTIAPFEQELFGPSQLNRPFTKRDALNAPEHLYNLFLTYDLEEQGTRFGLFYTVKGDTLVAGAGEEDNFFVPNIYAKEFGTLNFSAEQRFGSNWSLKFQAKNLTNPDIKTVYRSEFTGPDVTRTTFSRGLEFSLGLTFTL